MIERDKGLGIRLERVRNLREGLNAVLLPSRVSSMSKRLTNEEYIIVVDDFLSELNRQKAVVVAAFSLDEGIT